MDEIKREIKRIARFYTSEDQTESLEAALLHLVEISKEEGVQELLRMIHELKESKK